MVISMISRISPGGPAVAAAGLRCRAVGCAVSAAKIARARSIISRFSLVTGANRPRSMSTRVRRIESEANSGVPSTSKSRAGVKPIRTRCRLSSRLSMPPKAGPRMWIQSISSRSRPMLSSRVSINARGSCQRWKAAWIRLTPSRPTASCCRALVASSIRTCRRMSLVCDRTACWNLKPIQTWHSLPPLKERAAAVSAKTKNRVRSPRTLSSRSCRSPYSWSSICSIRSRETYRGVLP